MNALPPRLEYTTDDDHFYSYCLWEYPPAADPVGKFNSANLLYSTFAYAGMDERAYEFVNRLRAAIGPAQTVWGVKKLGDQIAWEYYFYDYRRRERTRSISAVLQALRPMIPCSIVPNESQHYFMFSLDINEAQLNQRKEIDKIHMYIGNVGSAVSSGISYGLTQGGCELENFYFFFKPANGMEPIEAKVMCSAYIQASDLSPAAILWPELATCHTICVANKRHHDCVYFSGVNIDQFLHFLERLDYPEPLVSFVRENRSKLDHLLYDVGFDYVVDSTGLRIVKSGYYGTF